MARDRFAGTYVLVSNHHLECLLLIRPVLFLLFFPLPTTLDSAPGLTQGDLLPKSIRLGSRILGSDHHRWMCPALCHTTFAFVILQFPWATASP